MSSSYSPPSAVVSETERPPEPRPRNVVLGVLCGAASLLIGVVQSAMTNPGGPWLIPVVVVAVLAGLLYGMWARRGWPRWVFLILFVLGLPVILFIKDVLIQQGPRAVAVLGVQTVFQAAALWLVFTPQANAWFRTRQRA